MKQLLFLFLFPCLAVAQYTGNDNQKITLGEQTTADGLVYRGLAADTTRKPIVDTMAYILLDTNTNIIWQYKKATNNAWVRVGGSISSGVTGTLPVANGGTSQSTLASNKVMVGNGTSGVLTPTNLHWDNTNFRLGIGTSSPTYTIEANGNIAAIGSGNINMAAISTNSFPLFQLIDQRSGGVTWNIECGRNIGHMQFRSNAIGQVIEILSNGEFLLGYEAADDKGAYQLQINGQPYATSALYVPSDEKYKENITPLNKGLEIINKLNPVTYNFISDTKNNFSVNEEVGFIAQDVDRALSTETFAKSIVNSADDSEPTSTMGLATQNLIPILVKAIQEQQALIKALEQRILILENK